MQRIKSSIQLYTDGSQNNRMCGKQWGSGWGVVALHDDIFYEFSGSKIVGKDCKDKHEYAAFLAAVKYAIDKGFDPDCMTFHVDCADIAYAQYCLHPENYYNRDWGVKFLCCMYCASHMVQCDIKYVAYALECINKSRFIKIKAHKQNCIYNSRANYIARREMRNLVKTKPLPLMDFEPWLQNGFSKYISSTEQVQWFAPFTNTLNEKHLEKQSFCYQQNRETP